MRESRETYDVFFLGIVPDINMGNSWSRDKEAQLVDRVEEAQVCLTLSFMNIHAKLHPLWVTPGLETKRHSLWTEWRKHRYA